MAELRSPQFLSDPKTDLAFPFLSGIFHPYLSFLPQAWAQLFCISETLGYLADLSSRSGISGGPGTTPGVKPGYVNLHRDVGKYLQKLLSASGS